MTPEFIADLISYKIIHMYILTISKIIVDNIHLFILLYFSEKNRISISCELSAIGREFI